MILSVERTSGDHRLYLALPRPITRDEFLSNAKVKPETYAWRMIDGMYRHIFESSLELKRDFETYYRLEYLDFFKYCRRRLRLTDAEAQQIAGLYDTSAVLIEYKRMYYFLRHENGLRLLETLLSEGNMK